MIVHVITISTVVILLLLIAIVLHQNSRLHQCEKQIHELLTNSAAISNIRRDVDIILQSLKRNAFMR
jgi:hypothetical protein